MAETKADEATSSASTASLKANETAEHTERAKSKADESTASAGAASDKLKETATSADLAMQKAEAASQSASSAKGKRYFQPEISANQAYKNSYS